jgi:hypothetical protein
MGYKSQYSYLRHQIVNVLGYPSKQFEEVYDDWLGEYLGDETDRGTFYRDPDCARYKTELAVFTKYVQAEPQLEFKGRDPGYAPRDEVQDPPKVRAATRTVVTAEESPVAAAATQTVAPAKNPFARMLQGKSTGAPATTSQTEFESSFPTRA